MNIEEFKNNKLEMVFQ